MADGDLYETDILAWSEQQASALRELASRRDLPNALDLAHVVEEIEDVGLSELNGAKSRIRLVLEHVIECCADPGAPSVPHWHREIGNWLIELKDRFAPSMGQRLDLDTLWRQAVQQARLGLAAAGCSTPAIDVQALGSVSCPLSLTDLLAEPADPAGLVRRLQATSQAPLAG